jgi:GDP-mannose transporter
MENRRKEEDPEIQRPLVDTSEAPEKPKIATAGGSGGSGGKAITSCFMYSFCSVSMVLVNKSLASSYNHLIQGDLNFLLVVIQAIVAVIAVEFCKMVKWVEYPKFNISTAMQWAPVNILFCGMLFTGMASLQHNSVPMVTVFKNITNIVVSMGDYYFFGTTVEGLIVAAFGIMLGGAILAAKNDHEITTLGVFWMAANCITTAGYILYMKFATNNVKLTKFGMVFYNNVLCTLFLLPVTIFNGELSLFLKTDAIHTFDYAWKNSFAGFVGFFLNFASLNCVSNTGPTTYAIVGSLNKVPIALLGWVLFSSQITPQTWFFIAVSMCGGFLYSYAKLRPSKKKISMATRDK